MPPSTPWRPCSSSQQSILRNAASLTEPGVAIRLRENLGNLDARNVTWSPTPSAAPPAAACAADKTIVDDSSARTAISEEASAATD
jgi:hypothetical protein